MKVTVLVLAAAGLLLTMAAPDDTQKITVHHTVQSGQTMYGIAEELAAKYGDRRDLREIVYHAKVASGKFRTVNGEKMFDVTIQPGEVLTYPLEVKR